MMGFRGAIRDILGIFIGFRIMLSPVFPLSINETVSFGLIILGFSFWFTMERIGFLK